MSLIQATLKYDRINTTVTDSICPEFPRGDTVYLIGTVTGKDLTGLAAAATLKMFVAGAQTPVVAATKTTGVGGGITIANSSEYLKTVLVEIASNTDTAGTEPGTRFVFDVEFKTTGATPESVFTIKGQFKISEDYTL